MIAGAGHSAPFVDIQVPAVDGKKDDTCRKLFESAGEIKDKDEARVPPLQTCTEMFCDVTTPTEMGGLFGRRCRRVQSHAHIRSCDADHGCFQDGAILVHPQKH